MANLEAAEDRRAQVAGKKMRKAAISFFADMLASFAKIEGDKIRSEHIYLDRQTVAEQLGHKAK